MRDKIREIIELQPAWSSENTPAMQRRGVIVRDELPTELSRYSRFLNTELGPEIRDLSFEGRDGTGRKTPIPWVRFYSLSRSPSAQNGWYCVYLFHPAASGLYLALAHGSTSFVNGSFQQRNPEEIEALVSWANSVVRARAANRADLARKIDLGNSRTKLARAYEASTVLAKWYPSDSLPDEEGLASDASFFAAMLGDLYRAQDLRRTPGDTSPEVQLLTEAVEAIARPLTNGKGGGQGRGLSGEERRAIEIRAMDVVRDLLEEENYVVHDVSLTSSYDFKAIRGEEECFVEVKGTTGGLGSVILTANEVELHHRETPSNGLFVVHSINLERAAEGPVARGGQLFRLQPWTIDNSKLKPIAFSYSLTD